MKFNIIAATVFVGAVSAVSLKERVAGIKERAASGAPVQRDEANVMFRKCRERFGDCQSCYDGYPFCQSDRIPDMINCLAYCDDCPGC